VEKDFDSRFKDSGDPPAAYVDPGVKLLLTIWFLLLVPWFPIALLAGMAVINGEWWGYVFVWSMWTYPVTLYVAFKFKSKVPALSLLPVLNLVGVFVSDFFSRPK